jgi:hypothetical protein
MSHKTNHLIYYGTGDDSQLIEKAEQCRENNFRLVFITPAVSKYKLNILEAQRILGEDFLIYETNMGMETVLAKRAQDYFKNNLNSFFEFPKKQEYDLNDCLCCYVETSCSIKHDYDLVRSCHIFNNPITAIGKGDTWEGFLTKVKLYINFLEKRNEKFVIATDSRDVLYSQNYQSILKTFLDKYYIRGHKVVFNAETNCFPNKELASQHPCQDKKYKYLNSGCFIGERTAIIDFWCDCLAIPNRFLKSPFDDQERAQYVFVNKVANDDFGVWLDYDCEIFQVLWDENGGRSANFDIEYQPHGIRNVFTDTSPGIFHFPGPTGHGNTVWKIINRKF